MFVVLLRNDCDFGLLHNYIPGMFFVNFDFLLVILDIFSGHA